MLIGEILIKLIQIHPLNQAITMDQRGSMLKIGNTAILNLKYHSEKKLERNRKILISQSTTRIWGKQLSELLLTGPTKLQAQN